MYIILSIITILVLISEIYQRKLSKGIDVYSYSVEKEFSDFEIRLYDAAYFNTVQLKDSAYQNASKKGFRILAGYIFGGNDENRQISMTSPVVMDMEEEITMKFMVPLNEDINKMPAANSKDIKLELVPEHRVAAITFGGWASSEKIKEYSDQLMKLLDQESIPHKNKFSYYGYNPPFQLTGRRNEIIVELE